MDKANEEEKTEEVLDSADVPESSSSHHLLYSIRSDPGLLNSIMFGLQQVLVIIAPVLNAPIVVANVICASGDNLVKVKLASSMLMISGIGTFLQTTIGVRLPIMQGPAFAFLVPILALMQLDEWRCPIPPPSQNGTTDSFASPANSTSLNDTTAIISDDDIWLDRIVVVQGGLILASLVQMLVGCTGIIGLLLRFIGPLTIVPTISLIGISLFSLINQFAGKQWGVAILVVCLFLLFSQYMGRVNVPFPSCSLDREVEEDSSLHKRCPEAKCSLLSLPVFSLFPYILTIVCTWTFCAILTASGALPTSPEKTGYAARTDLHLEVFQDSPWFRIPYPGQWGMPRLNFAVFIGMCFGTVASIVESIGDYYVTGRVCELPHPPAHAMNRGIATEGLACFIGGFIGGGLGVTSASEQVGTIQVTGVGCRKATQAAGIIFMLLACVPKLSATFIALPEPIIGGMLLVGLGFVTSMGLSNLQHVNLNLPRNTTILAVSLMMGLCLPIWIKNNPEAIKTGYVELDQALSFLIGTSMFVGGMTGCLLDNTIPGTRRDRGLIRPNHVGGINTKAYGDDAYSAYDLPEPIMCLAQHLPPKVIQVMPFLPRESLLKRKVKETNAENNSKA